MGIVGPQMITRRHQDPARAHSFDGSAGVVGRTDPVETGNPPQEQIIFGVEDINTRVSAFGQVVPRRRLIYPADVETKRISRYKDCTNQFDGLAQTISGMRIRAAFRRLMLRILARVCAHSQSRSRHQYQDETADPIRSHFVTPTGWLALPKRR